MKEFRQDLALAVLPTGYPTQNSAGARCRWCMHFLDPEVEPGCVGKVRRLSTELSGPNFDLGPHFSALILSLSTFSFSMHFFAFSDTEI